MATPTRPTTSSGRPTGQQPRGPTPPKAASTSSPAVRAAALQGAPRVTLDAPAAGPAEPVGTKLAADEVDLSTGALAIPDATAAGVKDGGDLDLKVRLPRLAEGTLRVRKRGTSFHTVGAGEAILLRHPALAQFSASNPTVLVLTVKDNQVSGWVGLGSPGPAKGSQRSLIDAIAKGADLMNWAGLSKLTFPAFQNKFEAGVITVSAENFAVTVGSFLQGSGNVALDNARISFDGSAKVTIPGGSEGELRIKQDPTGALTGSLNIMVQIGSVAGTVVATLSRGFVSIMGQVGYSGDRLSGKVTLAATDEVTARDITLAKPSAGGDVPIELPGPDKPARPGKRAFCGWGQLTFRVTDWLAGAATVIVNSKGQATIIGEIAPPKEFILFEQKEWIKKIFKLEIRAGYGIPVVGQVGLFASIGLDAIAKIGPGKLYNIKLSGAYSTDPRVAKNLAIEGTLNISAFAGLRLRAEAGLVVTILGHDIKAGVGLNAIAGVRGYVEATPRIGMRELAPGGKREYFIQGHLEIAAQPVLGFSGDLFVAIETPWWSPLSDKRWTWPLFSIEYPLPGEFGIGADVDYVLGSKRWPKIEFGEVNFDSSKFLTDVMNDNTDSGSGGETKKPGDWQEGLGATGKGGAKNKGGAGKKPGDVSDDFGPIGEEETFSDGNETHRIWFEEKGATATLMMASGSPSRVEKKLEAYEKSIELLYERDRGRATALLAAARAQLNGLGDEATRLAVMKLAARRAKEAYGKAKDKDKKKGKGGKADSKALKKQLVADERKFKDPVSKLALMLLEVPFKPIKRPAPMYKGQEAVEIASTKDHAEVQVARKNATDQLTAAASGPLSEGHNKAGLKVVRAAISTMAKIEERVVLAKIRSGKINAGVYKTLEGPATGAQRLIESLGEKLKIRNLGRLTIRPIERMARVAAVVFKAHPAELEAKGKEKAKPGKLYATAFIDELKRQVELQDAGLNKLSVDEWVINVNLYAMDQARFRKLDVSARKGILDELKKRADTALKNTRKRKAELKTAVAALKLAIQATNADQVVAPSAAAVNVDRVTGRTGNEVKFRDEIKKATKKKGEALKRLLDDQLKAWELLADGTSELAILHNADQVAGGYDRFDPLPAAPTDPNDHVAWKTYLDILKKHVGPMAVNSSLGAQWKNEVNDAYKRVTHAVPQESYPINRMNLPLQTKVT